MAHEPTAESTTAIVNARVFDGRSDQAIPDGGALLKGTKIHSIGPMDMLELTGVDSRIDAGGRFLMPGMVDAHVHLQYPMTAPGNWQMSLVEHPEVTTIRATRNAQAYLASGFTSVMDVGCRGNLAVAIRDAVRQGLCIGPRVVASGLPISPTGGLCDHEASFVENLYPRGIVADTTDEWRKAIRAEIKDGVDNIKIAINGDANNPYSDPYVSLLSLEELELICAEVHKAGKSVAAHVHVADGVEDAARAGVDTVHHGWYMGRRSVDALLTSASTYYVPTSFKMQAFIERGAEVGRLPQVIEYWARTQDQFLPVLAEGIAAGLHEKIALGSDASNAPPHGHTARELRVLVGCGMSPGQALQCATRIGAQAVHLDHLVGTLEAGKEADLLLVDGDPMTDVTVLEDPSRLTVYMAGKKVAERGEIAFHLDVWRPLKAELYWDRAL